MFPTPGMGDVYGKESPRRGFASLRNNHQNLFVYHICWSVDHFLNGFLTQNVAQKKKPVCVCITFAMIKPGPPCGTGLAARSSARRRRAPGRAASPALASSPRRGGGGANKQRPPPRLEKKKRKAPNPVVHRSLICLTQGYKVTVCNI